jgi:hypothetical protein
VDAFSTVILHFERGEAAGEHLVAFFPRSDIGDRGRGFILFSRGNADNLGYFHSITIQTDDATETLVPNPRPACLLELELRGPWRDRYNHQQREKV